MEVATSLAPADRRETSRRRRRRFPDARNGSSMRSSRSQLAICAVCLVAFTGCMAKKANVFQRDHDVALYESVAARVDYPDHQLACEPEFDPPQIPHTLNSSGEVTYWPLHLQEAIEHALEHSEVLQDLGGTVLRSPESVQTSYSVAIQAADPRFGAEAALSAFDAQFAAAAFFEKNDRQLNNTFFGGGTRLLQQDVNDYQAQISKFGVTGGEFALRNKINYDNNNAPGNAFPHAYTNELEAEIRHPLLQGAGAEFNRLAGPSRTPGLVNGVMIARVNNKITQADFELALRNYVSNVENAYWDLYFAYRNLDAKMQARDRALHTWQIIITKKKEGSLGADKEALAREQYYRFQEEVQNALTGRQEDGTRTNNGSTGGAFRGTGGVHIAERRLRLLMGVRINDERLIRPKDEPEMVRIVLDWDSVVSEAYARRTELKRQRLLVQRREMELLANRNFLAPRLDAVGLYRWRGFGRDLIEQGGNQSAIDDLTGGAFQEWQLGIQLDVPIGFRRAHAAVQNSELLLAKERAILREQERQIGHDLSNAIGEIDRSYEICQTNLNRYRAALDYLESLEVKRRQDLRVDFEKILDAQNRVAAAETRYFLTRVEYALAIKNVNFEKGSLLEYHNLLTQDGVDVAKKDDSVGRRNIATTRPPIMQLDAAPAKTPVAKKEQPAAAESNSSPIRPVSATKDDEEKPLFDMFSDGPFSLD